ncbi:MAG TPA: adenylosuccinate synthase [Candidatus Eremiobacteraceae bacterium]|nr:adenylosuccinate synthase [Candidatus Eremiobacteraceae bacterium]
MPVHVVVGAQWGDEGKGRIVDFLSTRADIAARYGGGANAGHTVRVGEKTYKLRIVPSGAVAGCEACIIGPGTVIHPETFLAEIEKLAMAGVDTSRIWISDLAHLIMPYHIALERSRETARGADALGTTGNGIGPAYGDRVARTGIRAGDLREPARCKAIIAAKSAELGSAGIAFDPAEVWRGLEALSATLLAHVCDTVSMINVALDHGKTVLAEGAQGSMLDVGLGTYPYVTSSVTVAGGAGAGLGFGPTRIASVIGVSKAYATRVGSGPFPTEDLGEAGERLRAIGREVGVVTGRARRCGWLDLVGLRYAVAVNGITELALTKLDVLDDFDEIQVGVGYDGDAALSVPLQIAAGAKPRFQSLPGWKEPTVNTRTFGDLPAHARSYVEFVERACGIPVTLISVGPERSQIVERGARIPVQAAGA